MIDGMPIDIDALGRRVREVWIEWAERQPAPKPSWLVPYDELSEPEQVVDRLIGASLWGDGFSQGSLTALNVMTDAARTQLIEEAIAAFWHSLFGDEYDGSEDWDEQNVALSKLLFVLVMQRDTAVHLLQKWLDWCFDEHGVHARPDKWSLEFIEHRELTGGDANDALRVARERIGLQQEQIASLRETAVGAQINAADLASRLESADMMRDLFIRMLRQDEERHTQAHFQSNEAIPEPSCDVCVAREALGLNKPQLSEGTKDG